MYVAWSDPQIAFPARRSDGKYQNITDGFPSQGGALSRLQVGQTLGKAYEAGGGG